MRRYIVLLIYLLPLQIFSAYGGKKITKENTVIISGTIENGLTGDTVLITIFPFGIDYKFLNNTYYAILSGKRFRQIIKRVTHPMYVSLFFKKTTGEERMEYNNSNLRIYLIEPGDNIQIRRQAGRFIFAGRGSAKFQLQNEFDSIMHTRQNTLKKVISPELQAYEYACDTITNIDLDYLARYKKKLSRQAYELIYYNLLSIGAIRKQNFILEGPDQVSRALHYLTSCINIFSEEEQKLIDQPDQIVIYSNFFQDFVIEQWQVEYFKAYGRKPGLADLFTHIERKYQGVIREKLLCALLLKNRKNTTDLGPCLDKAALYMRTAYFESLLNGLRTSRLPGMIAIDFDLTDSNGKRYGLKNFSGKVLVLDFWFTGCSNCIRLKPFLAALEPRVDKGKVVFLTISADAKKEIWLKSVRSGLYTTAFSLDLLGDNLISGPSIFKSYNIDNYPTLIVISKSGKLMRNVIDPRVDKGEDLLALIQEGLQETHASAD
jgi:thiol-disulfide isomerase/thioredoxin